jgi:hypothetical protein
MSATWTAASFVPPGARILSRYFAVHSGFMSPFWWNGVRRSFAMTSDYIYV